MSGQNEWSPPESYILLSEWEHIMEDKICDERHLRIDSALDRIERKVDVLIWKFLAFAISLMGLMLGGIKLLK